MCDRQSLICYVNRDMTFSTCELSRFNTPYSYCVSTSPLLYRQYLHPQRYFYAWYLMHHSHLHSELVHDLFSFHWNGILQYHPLIDWYDILIPKVCLCSNPSEMFHYSPQQEFQYHDRYSNQSPCVQSYSCSHFCCFHLDKRMGNQLLVKFF